MKFSTTQALSTVALASLASAAPGVPLKNLAKRGIEGGNNMGTWWGQADDTSVTLEDVCGDDTYGYVYVSFLTEVNPPKLNLAGFGAPATSAQKAAGFGDLIDASHLADQVSACQSSGKKIMISFGGDASVSDSTFESVEDATTGAQQIWDLFLGGGSNMTAVRPFGPDVVLDGVDLDNESGNGSFYVDFVKELRNLFSKDSSKQYYISSAPQCPAVDPTEDDSTVNIPDDSMAYQDFINVQFYNNQACMIGSDSFADSIKAWSDKLNDISSDVGLMLAVPASNRAATGDNVGVLPADQLQDQINMVQDLNLPNFVGVAVWDATYAALNDNIQHAVRDALDD
jgi:chitinase